MVETDHQVKVGHHVKIRLSTKKVIIGSNPLANNNYQPDKTSL